MSALWCRCSRGSRRQTLVSLSLLLLTQSGATRRRPAPRGRRRGLCGGKQTNLVRGAAAVVALIRSRDAFGSGCGTQPPSKVLST